MLLYRVEHLQREQANQHDKKGNNKAFQRRGPEL
jgi:hypothetical protein